MTEPKEYALRRRIDTLLARVQELEEEARAVKSENKRLCKVISEGLAENRRLREALHDAVSQIDPFHVDTEEWEELLKEEP